MTEQGPCRVPGAAGGNDDRFCVADTMLSFRGTSPLRDDAGSALFRADPVRPPDEVWEVRETPGPFPKETGRCLIRTRSYAWYEDHGTLRLHTLDLRNGEVVCISEHPADGAAPPTLTCLSTLSEYCLRTDRVWTEIDLPYRLLAHDTLTLHSASILWRDRTILFSAASGVGKSTQARLWQQYRGAVVLNGDKNVLRQQNGCLCSWGFPLSGTSGICHEYRHPAGAVVMLSQAPENVLRRLSPIESFRALMRNSFGCTVLPGCAAMLTSLCVRIAETVPVYSLACTPDEAAVAVLEKELLQVI